MEEIMYSVAVRCDNNDCPHAWHQEHYWSYADGTYSVCDDDGNHDDVEEEDLPTAQQVDQSWKDYAAYVVETGADPLHNYFGVSTHRKANERWQFRFSRSILGVLLIAARRGGKEIPTQDLPPHVLEYLTIDATKNPLRLTAFPRCIDFESVIKPSQWGKWVPFTIEHRVDRPAATVAAELRRMARKHLRAA